MADCFFLQGLIYILKLFTGLPLKNWIVLVSMFQGLKSS